MIYLNEIVDTKMKTFIETFKQVMLNNNFEVVNETVKNTKYTFDFVKLSHFEAKHGLFSAYQTHTVRHAITLEDDKQLVYDLLNETLDELDAGGSFGGTFGLTADAVYRRCGTSFIYNQKQLYS